MSSFLEGLQQHGQRVSAQLIERARWHSQQALKFEEMAKRLEHHMPAAIEQLHAAKESMEQFEDMLRANHE